MQFMLYIDFFLSRSEIKIKKSRYFENDFD